MFRAAMEAVGMNAAASAANDEGPLDFGGRGRGLAKSPTWLMFTAL